MPEYIKFEDRIGRATTHHYSVRPSDALLFYGGPFSNFVGGPWEIRDYDGIVYLAQNEKLKRDREIAHSTHLVEYPTIEHYFQANKAITREAHDHIRTQHGPWQAKKAGRSTPLRSDWEEIKYGVMMIALRVKFSHEDFREILMATGNRLIAEDSPTDYVWGIRDAQGGYTGTNLLGKALMQIRDEVREGVYPVAATS
jgi:hypothetical protein